MQILTPTFENIQTAAELLKNGDVIGMPTETVYGLAGNVFDEAALAKIFSVKERPTFDPLIVHVAYSSLAELHEHRIIDANKLSAVAQTYVSQLMTAFWPGPLTLVLPKNKAIPDLATSGLPTVAVRMPSHEVAQNLIRATGFPLAAPSANRFGRISPTSAEHVASELGDRITLTLDGGSCTIGLESTIIEVGNAGEITLLRPGQVSPQEIETVTGVKVTIHTQVPAGSESPAAPGMLASHYAPKKPLFVLPAREKELLTKPLVGLLVRSGSALKAAENLESKLGVKVIARSLSLDGDLSEMARNLFSSLRELDESEAEVLYTEAFSVEASSGLAYAIADRLKRATASAMTSERGNHHA